MRLNMTQQGGLADEFVTGGGSVLNPLYLSADPAVPLGAATKQYVDNALQSLNANNLINGTIGAARFPAMNGDLTSSSGSTSLILANTGVTPGTYAKVTVDLKGRVLNGLPLVEDDIPNFSWNKITSDKPTTIDGYGITDALKSSGGTMTGLLSVSGIPTQSNQLVNKSYLDSVVGGTTGIAVGDIVTKIDSSTPVGFLRCNGAELNTSDYPDLYSAIGDRYVLNGQAGNGQPWRNQYNINTENNGDLTNWRAIQSLPGVLGGATSFVTKNRVYVYGGFNGGSHVGTGYTAQLNNDGSLGPWSAATALPGVFAYSQSVVAKNKVYILGGYINNSAPGNIVYVADINADGTLGAWGNGPNMPGAMAWTHIFINVNRLYVVGGYNGTGLNSVYSCDIKEDGTLGVWSTESNFPVTIYTSSLVTTKNRVYLLGGIQTSTYSNVIYSAALNSDGSIGSWTVTGYLPVTTGYHVAITTRNFIYLIGGVQNGGHSANIYKAIIYSDGSFGSWQLQSSTLPATLTYSNINICKDRIYTFGGMVSGGWSAACWVGDMTGGLNDYSSFYSNVIATNYMVAGSGKPWQQQYQINETQSADITDWVTDISTTPTSNFRTSVAVTKNRVYMIGGWNGTTAQNTVYTAPINADGTLGSWVSETNFPVGILGTQLVTIGDKLYAIGGSDNSAYYASVYTAPINIDGTLGTWTTVNSLPAGISSGQVILTRNRIYYLGGFNGSYLTTVYTASVFASGEIGTWSSGTSLPMSVCHAQAFVTKNRVYLVGGQTTNGNWINNVYTTSINADGTLGTWVSSGTIPDSLGESSIFVTKNTVYLLGGGNTNGYSLNVYRASINSDGIIGSWVSGTTLPAELGISPIVITKNHLYLLGGAGSSGGTNVIYSAPILEGLNDYSSYYAEDINNYCYPGSGRPWQQQYQINTTQSAEVTGWVSGTSLPTQFGWSQAIVTKNRVYLLGGSNGSNTISNVYTAVINEDGTLGAWVTDLSLPGPLSASQAIVTKNRVYLLGGFNNSIYTSIVYTAPINSDGTLGTWTTGISLPDGRGYSQAIRTKNYVFIIGGFNGSALSTVYYAKINTDGTLGGWIQAASLPGPLAYSTTVITKNRVYLLGGSNGSAVNTVYTAPISSDGIIGNWISSTPLSANLQASQSVVVKNKVYLLGGWKNPSSAIIQIATINEDGTLSSFTEQSTSLPGSLHMSQVIIVKNNIYLLGGASGSTWQNSVSTVYQSSFSSSIQDHSPYYNGDILPIEQFIVADKFKLPDASFANDGLNYFIKY